MLFNEAELEKSIVDLIANKGYKYIYGEELDRNYEDIIIESDLNIFLKQKYINEEITDEEIKSIVLSLKSISSADLFDANKRTFIKMAYAL